MCGFLEFLTNQNNRLFEKRNWFDLCLVDPMLYDNICLPLKGFIEVSYKSLALFRIYVCALIKLPFSKRSSKDSKNCFFKSSIEVGFSQSV